MTSKQDPESNESDELSELFRKTAETPSDLERSRMLARARSIPGARTRWLTPRLLWPGALAAAAATAFLVLAPPGTRDRTAKPSPSAKTEARVAPPAPVAVVPSAETATSEEATTYVDE